LDDALSFGTDPTSRKACNLRANPKVVVHLESGDECVILEDAVEGEEEAAPGLRRRVGEAYAVKYGLNALGSVDEDGPPVYVLRPRVASACCVCASRSRGWRAASLRPRRGGVSRSGAVCGLGDPGLGRADAARRPEAEEDLPDQVFLRYWTEDAGVLGVATVVPQHEHVVRGHLSRAVGGLELLVVVVHVGFSLGLAVHVESVVANRYLVAG
jgi:hypothetical protein